MSQTLAQRLALAQIIAAECRPRVLARRAYHDPINPFSAMARRGDERDIVQRICLMHQVRQEIAA